MAALAIASVCSPYGWARSRRPSECAQSRSAVTWCSLNSSETVSQ